MASSSSSSSQWHTINPQTRPLTLSILELTPLALTLSLTLAPPPSPSLPPLPRSSSHQHVAHTHNHTHGPAAARHRKKTRHRRPDSDDEATAVEVDDEGHPIAALPGSYPTAPFLDPSTNFKDLLSHGVVVCVNGQPWNRIVAHVSEPDDEGLGLEGDVEYHEHDGTEADAEWEDDFEHALRVDGEDDAEEGIGHENGNGMVRRRPRKARFNLSAGRAVQGDREHSRPPSRRPSGTEKRVQRREDRDQAVVVVYGLSPGLEYEIELQVLGMAGQDGTDPLISNSIHVPSSPSHGHVALPRSRANSFLARSQPATRSNSMIEPHPGRPPYVSSHLHASALALEADGSSSAGSTPPPTNGQSEPHALPIPTNILNPVDTQAAQIRHMIAASHAERDHLQIQIKEARRASQRAEAALRAEIETVKRAIDKAGSLDLRARQKTLALQEQVKQGWAGAEHADHQSEFVGDGMSQLERDLESANVEVENVKKQWRAVKDEEEDAREKDKKARAEEEKKLAEVLGKIDKLKVKKEKKESEKAELEAKLAEFERQKEEAERRVEEERFARRSSAYWWDPHAQGGHHPPHAHHPHPHGHPHDHGARGRGGFQPRFPSGGPPRPIPPPSQPSPTMSNAFYSTPHPVPPSNPSPAFRPTLPPSQSANRVPSTSNSGVNAAAAPFHPSANYDPAQHTALMPPQLQHRIYPPGERPKPTPTFTPPPSVLAEQAKTASPTSVSPPSFPPLPRQGSPAPGELSKVTISPAPSLASIVTRAVLSPTSALANQSTPGPLGGRSSPVPGSKPSPPPGNVTPLNTSMRTYSGTFPLASPIPPLGSMSDPSSPVNLTSPHALPTVHPAQSPHLTHSPHSPHSAIHLRQPNFGPPPERKDDFPPLSPTGPPGISPWTGAAGVYRTATPPIQMMRKASPLSSSIGQGGSIGSQSGAMSPKSSS